MDYLREQLEKKISHLEGQLEEAKTLLHRNSISQPLTPINAFFRSPEISHALLLLSDSALPLGSFAYSSGLESYILHNRPLPSDTTPLTSFLRFLSLSMASIANSTLPYVIQGHREPSRLGDLDNDIDASTPCSVSRRASVAQGMALLTVWERSLRASYSAKSGFNNRDKEETAENIHNTSSQSAVAALQSFSESVKHDSGEDESTTLLDGTVNGHFGPLWGTVCLAMGVNLQQTSYVFILNHAKAVLSAAVRSSVMGPYQAQEILASEVLQDLIWQLIEKEWYTKPEDAGQIAPVIDLWMGRHELLYSRIFNS